MTITLHSWFSGAWVVVVRWDKQFGFEWAARPRQSSDYSKRRACYASAEQARAAARAWIRREGRTV